MEALLKLIEKYKGISLELLKGSFNAENTTGDDVMRFVTGFGNTQSCSICEDARQKAHKPLYHPCEYCIYKNYFQIRIQIHYIVQMIVIIVYLKLKMLKSYTKQYKKEYKY